MTFEDDNVFLGTIIGICGHGIDPINHLHPTANPSKDGMSSVKPWTWRKGNVELTAVSVGTSIGHSDDTGPHMLQGGRLILKGGAVDGFASGACARRIAALNHEILLDIRLTEDGCLYQTMKDSLVIVATSGERGKILARSGGLIPIQFYFETSLRLSRGK